MDTAEVIAKKFNLDLDQKSPIVIRTSRFKGLIELFKELNFKVGAEIGVAGGKFSQWLFHGIPGLKLYAIDPWESYKDYVEHHDEVGQIILDDCLAKAQQRLTGKNVEFIRKFSMDVVKDFKDNSLDFVFIDGNHTFEYVINDIAEWSKKVRPGGIIAGHDFWNSIRERRIMPELTDDKERIKLCQVKDAVYSWTATNQIKLWFVTKGDSCPSWMFIKR